MNLDIKALHRIAIRSAREGFFVQRTREPSFHRNQVSKSPRAGRRLLAGTAEDPLVARIPEVVRIAPAAAAEPQPRIIALHKEQPRVAARINNGLHGDENPLAVGLILVLQSKLRTDFRRAGLQTEIPDAFINLIAPRTLFEAEFSDRGLN